MEVRAAGYSVLIARSMLPYFPGYARLFLCRHCYGLPYASNTEDALNRSASQKYKLGERIFEYYEYGDGWGKRKGCTRGLLTVCIKNVAGLMM
jgi:hypothetical protein